MGKSRGLGFIPGGMGRSMKESGEQMSLKGRAS